MAATESHRFLGGDARVDHTPVNKDQFELEEADILWSTDDIIFPPEKTEHANFKHRKHYRKSVVTKGDRHPPIGAKSVPVSIPDWSKILGGEFRIRAAAEYGGDEYEEEDWGNDRIAPHEYLARTRVASLSVHEGVGRTLKGRDLSRVRNAIWKKTGFED